MDTLGERALARAILSKKSPEDLASETRHMGRVTLLRLSSTDMLNQSKCLLYDHTATVEIYSELTERLLMGLVTRLQRQIIRDVINQRRQKGNDTRVRRSRGVGKQAARVFYLLCSNHSETDISRMLGVSRERVRQVKEKLKTLPTVKKFYKELKGEYRGKW